MKKCKITVLKTSLFRDLADQLGKNDDFSSCPVFKEGESFITGGPFGNSMPENFCHMAWQSLELPVNVLAGGGKFLGFEEKTVVSCMDGIRPAIFLVEPIEEDCD